MGYKNRNVAHKPDALAIGIGFQFVPLLKELPLAEFMFIDTAGILHAGGF